MGRHRVFWGIVLIGVGLSLLLQRIGWWPAQTLRLIVAPLVLIGFGAYVLWAAANRREPEVEEVAIPREGLGRARVSVKHAAGRLRVGSGAALDQLLAGSFAGGAVQRVTREGASAEVDLRAREGGEAWMGWSAGRWGGLAWDIRLNPEVTLDLRVQTGAGEAVLDLGDLEVTALNLQTGVGATRVRLPAGAGRTSAQIQTGVGAVTIRVPDGVAARIRAESGLGEVQVNRERFPRTGGVYESPDYATATDAVDLDLRSGVGAVRVE